MVTAGLRLAGTHNKIGDPRDSVTGGRRGEENLRTHYLGGGGLDVCASGSFFSQS